MEFLAPAFHAMNRYSQFIIYKLVPKHNGKMDKLPADWQTGKIIDAHDSRYWTDSTTAIAAAKRFGLDYGVGFVFTKNDPFWFVDIDNCLVDGQWSATAIEIMTLFNGAALEVSSSDRGIHIFGSGVVPPHGCRNQQLGLEFYDSGRFVALTGKQTSGDAGFDASAIMPYFVATYMPKDVAPTRDDNWWSTTHCEGSTPIPDDDQLIQALLNEKPSAATAFGSGVSAADLWYANDTVLAKAYPSDRDVFDHSAADAALAHKLAFYTGNNAERIMRLMNQSGLVRDKWEREDYLPLTIRNACGRQKRFFDNRSQNNTTGPGGQDPILKPTVAAENRFMTVEEQRQFFDGFVYISDEHRIYAPSGVRYDHSSFRARYGGRQFILDPAGEKSTRDAWEIITESQALRFPKVDQSCYRPDLEGGKIFTINKLTCINIYRPSNIQYVPGDVSLFLRHLELLLPDPHDRLILLSYLAALIQYPGYKFRWCPVIQGVEGNGKSLITGIVARAIGVEHVHYPRASEMGGRFNDWMFGNRLAGVEDFHSKDDFGKKVEEMKVMITNEYIEIESKGGKKVTRENRINFIINTNYRDGLPQSRDGRRYTPFHTAQQSKQDRLDCGMDDEYFHRLHTRLKSGGQEAINHYLLTFAIPDELNPAVRCFEAPISSSTEIAIRSSYSRAQQEVLEAIAQNEPGLRRGWVSSIRLDVVLERQFGSRKPSPNRRSEIMESLGYILHPGLTNDGRTPRDVQPDGKRPRLYVKKNHPTIGLKDPGEIAKAYERDQA